MNPKDYDVIHVDEKNPMWQITPWEKFLLCFIPPRYISSWEGGSGKILKIKVMRRKLYVMAEENRW